MISTYKILSYLQILSAAIAMVLNNTTNISHYGRIISLVKIKLKVLTNHEIGVHMVTTLQWFITTT